MQNTELLQVRVSKELKQYLKILHEKYNINSSEFVRMAIVEKLQKDVPIIRKKHKDKTCFKVPF